MRWVALAPLVMLVAGCLGADDRESPKARYVHEANAICRQGAARQAALPKPSANKRASYERYVAASAVIGREARARLNELEVPASLRSWSSERRETMRTLSRQSKRLKRATAQVSSDLRRKRFSGAIVKKHETELRRAERDVLATIERVRRLYKRIGIEQCAST